MLNDFDVILTRSVRLAFVLMWLVEIPTNLRRNILEMHGVSKKLLCVSTDYGWLLYIPSANMCIYALRKKVLSRTLKGSSAQRSAGSFEGSR